MELNESEFFIKERINVLACRSTGCMYVYQAADRFMIFACRRRVSMKAEISHLN